MRSSSASSRASVSSESLRPPGEKNLTPLSGKGLCEAEMTAAGRPSAADRKATPGVGSTPRSPTSAPSVARPADRAACRSGPDKRVSRPMRNRGRCPPLRGPLGPLAMTRAAARPRARTNSGVRSALATPRTPSVPNRRVTEDRRRLSLGVLGGLPGLLQAVLLAFLLASVTGEEAGTLQGGPQLLVQVDQAPGNAEAEGAGLAGDAAPVHGGVHVIRLVERGQPQRLGDDHPVRLR